MSVTGSGKVAWVTGVNQGIGAQLMKQLLDAGIRVVGVDHRHDSLPAHLRSLVHLCDVGDGARVRELCARLLPEAPPDYFINVAAVLRMGAHEQLSEAHWLETFAVNVHAPYHFLSCLTPHFRQRRAGSIVMVSSNAARVPRMGMAAYGASKAALTHFSKAVALELAGDGVRVNTVSPGSTLTPMQYALWTDAQSEQRTLQGNLAQFKSGIPLNRIANPEDIANAVLFLISDQAAHITLHDLVVDGGATLGM
ncbi:2,3-dihydro-2,3-dihydroxybenzoate dehydrogenase [Pseudomonas japonica]|uniref:2,3-dihydro-2,3-dihydroxybenzoate dehydrogenase n=1 Tax=Pseudomonas japonica TaxID=256466 RepID=A0A239KV91_9PSED|nr:2,3-dihydro-2,3-dihydroxybenzoate dehydrogenase [Pseudomonas japonica]SNT21975.1 2,3-dihydro-2,3-dihydroxybenzoate dehydrogenase [Pseudomonas japonica]